MRREIDDLLADLEDLDDLDHPPKSAAKSAQAYQDRPAYRPQADYAKAYVQDRPAYQPQAASELRYEAKAYVQDRPAYQPQAASEPRFEAKAYVQTASVRPPIREVSGYPKTSTLDDLMDCMADVEHDDVGFRPVSVPVTSASKKLRKCYPIFVGTAEAGLCQGSQRPKVCDKLRCTDCDLEVKRFLGSVWDSSVDYLFFRNNYSRADQLRLNLHPQSDSCAYSCQCRWNSWRGVERVPEPSWVCGGHFC
jgi:hypothetical protein